MNKYPIAKPYIDDSDIRGVTQVLKSGWLSLGPKYKEFEQEFAKYTGAKYALAVSSGTAGLHLAIKALNLKPGDEVITTPFSFVASSNCLLFESVKPVFVDIDQQTFNMDPLKIEAVITPRTKAILVVHVFGKPCDMARIMKIAKKHKLKVIEDACESLGSKIDSKMSGTIGDVGVYSFYPNKQMTTGEGAIIVTNSKKVFELCDSMRNQGRALRSSKFSLEWNWLISERLGYNYRMNEMNAALGLTQLKKLNWMIGKRMEVASWYEDNLSKKSEIILPKKELDGYNFFVYVVRFTNGDRNKIMDKLNKEGIQTRPYFPVIHLQPFMKKMFGFKKGNFPIAEKVASQTLALPFYIGLKKTDVEHICNKIIDCL